MFTPNLAILPPAQLRLWNELVLTPAHFTLVGGTALALRLGHRESVDFDFFSAQTFAPRALLQTIPYLKNATIRQEEPNTLTVTVERNGPVLVSFFGGLNLGQVRPPDIAPDNHLKVASAEDIAGMKLAVITQRAEAKDYVDIYALLQQTNITLPDMLGAAQTIYGTEFNALTALKALCYFDEPALQALPTALKQKLLAEAAAVGRV